ncbi:MAG TPA: helix-turn-helix domain-containing protein [Solirubrobacteraceae bacterium]|nr:helix-turn-helix domain-containing protein [Solirubrobacteraceae bacterium]
MRIDEQHPISIKLYPAQVEEVVRAATGSDGPSISALIADTLSAPLPSADPRTDANSGADTKPGAPAEARAAEESSRRGVGPGEHLRQRMPIGEIDPRLSRSLFRGLSVLTCFTPDGKPRGVLEIADELGMSPSTTHRYALTLVELGLLRRSPTTRKYSLPTP